MNENTEILLRQLAEKLGTTSEYLWQNLLNQAPISGSFGILYVTIIISAIIFFAKIIKKKIPTWKQKKADFEINFNLTVFGISMSFFGGGSLVILHNSVTAFMNPGFWAMKEILYLLK